jgi:cell division septal protein FtsQ
MRDYKDYRARRITKKRSGKRLAPGAIKGGVALIGILVLAGLAKYPSRWLLTTNYFALKEVAVTGEKRVERDEIVALSGVRPGENILTIDLEGVARRVEGQPWVERATVRRILPGGLSIDIREREPFAILKADGLFYMDRSGTPFKELDDKDDSRYPVLTGLSREEVENEELARDAMMKALDFIESEANNWPQELPISFMNVNKNQGITVFSDNVGVKVGFGEYQVKLGRLRRVLDDLKARGKTAEYIDLTYTGQVVVR